MIVVGWARRCRLEGGRDARVGEPDAQGQQAAEQRARCRPRQHISSAAARDPVVRRPRRCSSPCHRELVCPRATWLTHLTTNASLRARYGTLGLSLSLFFFFPSQRETTYLTRARSLGEHSTFLKEHHRLTARDGRTLSRARSLSRHTAHTIAESIFERNIDSPASRERETLVLILAALP